MTNGMAKRSVVLVGIWAALGAAAAPAIAKDPAARPPAAGTNELQRAVAQAAAQQEEVQRLKAMRGDPDQGDDNASARAKEVVCTKDTPAAQRSAICDTASPN